MTNNSTYTPRTDTCNHCGAFFLTHHTPAYCEERAVRKKAEAEVERLRANLNRTIKIALMIWGDKPSDKGWPELRAELAELKATLNHTEK